MTPIPNVENLLPWGKPNEISTKLGPRILRCARPDEAFWITWNANKEGCKAAGISIGKDREDETKWRVCWWAELPKAVMAQRAENLEQSRAVSTDVEIPRPEGLDYLPFQKAGITFALRNWEGGSPAHGVLLADEPGL